MPDMAPRTVSAPPKAAQPARRGRSGIFNLLLIIGIIAAIALFAWAEQQRRATENRLEQTKQELEEVKKSTRAGGEELAKRVLEKLRTHMEVPVEPAPTVATIVDIERLREANEFYKPAENGDHLIITDRRAILYDPDRDIILDVVPVVIDQNAQTTPLTSPRPTTSPQPTGGASPRPTATPAGTAASPAP